MAKLRVVAATCPCCVALRINDGPAIGLSPMDARRLAADLVAAADRLEA